VPVVLKSRSLSLFKPSEPVQACTGVDLQAYDANIHSHAFFTSQMAEKILFVFLISRKMAML